MITKERSTNIENFITPVQGFFNRAWPYKLYSKNALVIFFKKTLFSIAEHRSDKLSRYNNDDEGMIYHNCKFHNPRVEFVVVRFCHTDYIVKMLNLLKSSLLMGIKQTNWNMMSKEFDDPLSI